MALKDLLTPDEYKTYRRGINSRSQRKRRKLVAVVEAEARDAEQRRWDLKRELAERLGGQCQRCAWRPQRLIEFAGFDFHHREPSTKSFGLASAKSRRVDTLQAEVDKCDLLCARCHKITEAELRGAKRIAARIRLPRVTTVSACDPLEPPDPPGPPSSIRGNPLSSRAL